MTHPLPVPEDGSFAHRTDRYALLTDAQGRRLLVERPGWGDDAEIVLTADAEYRKWIHVDHPNVVRLVGSSEDGKMVYWYYDHVPSWQLSTLLAIARKQLTHVPFGVAAAIVMDLLLGVQSIHETKGAADKVVNLVHRKVDPDHILVGLDGVTRVLLPGFAWLEDRPGCRGPAAIILQRFRYMSPEQVKGLPLDGRSDLYTVAVVLWEMLTGQIFAKSNSDFEVVTKIMAGVWPRPSSVRSDLPEDLDDIVMKALSLAPLDRFADAVSLPKALSSTVAIALSSDVTAWARGLRCKEFPRG